MWGWCEVFIPSCGPKAGSMSPALETVGSAHTELLWSCCHRDSDPFEFEEHMWSPSAHTEVAVLILGGVVSLGGDLLQLCRRPQSLWSLHPDFFQGCHFSLGLG